MITRETALNYIKLQLNSIENIYNLNCNYVAFNDARELMGVIHFLWQKNIISTDERDVFISECYEWQEKTGCWVTS